MFVVLAGGAYMCGCPDWTGKPRSLWTGLFLVHAPYNTDLLTHFYIIGFDHAGSPHGTWTAYRYDP